MDTLNIACRRINFSLGFHGSFDAVICKHFSVHVKKHCFLILHGMVLTHALWNETFLHSEVPSSFLVNTVQTLSKSVYNCQSYWQKFRGTFFYGPLCIWVEISSIQHPAWHITSLYKDNLPSQSLDLVQNNHKLNITELYAWQYIITVCSELLAYHCILGLSHTTKFSVQVTGTRISFQKIVNNSARSLS